MDTTYRKQYNCLLFDLDRTLWDYKSNSEQTLFELLNKYTPELMPELKNFLQVYYEINETLWEHYRDGKLTKEILMVKRFQDAFDKFNINSSPFVESLAEDYIIESPKKTMLYPNTIETLTYLNKKKYRLILLTNGFLEVQEVKIKESEIEPFFEQMITSEEAGFQKPDPKIFDYALRKIGAIKSECIMIGDDPYNDIYGARNFGIDTVYANLEKITHQDTPTFEINNLIELKEIF